MEGVPSPLCSDSCCMEPAVYTESPALSRTRVRPWATTLESSARFSGGWGDAEGHLTPAAVVAHGAPAGGPARGNELGQQPCGLPGPWLGPLDLPIQGRMEPRDVDEGG